MLKSVLPLVLLLVVTSHGDSVLETARQNGCGKLYNLVAGANLKDALENAQGVTFFAPSDAAVSALSDKIVQEFTHNVTLLQDVLKFHVVTSVKMASDLVNEELLPTLDTSLMLRTNIYKNGKVLTAEGSVISKPNLKSSNGVVHVIDRVIYPLPTLSTPLYLTFNKDLNNLGFLAYQGNLIQKLADQGLTVFAPTNEAIEKLPGQEYNDLLMNITLLQSVLKYHVVNGTVYSAALDSHQMVTTLQGAALDIKASSGDVTLNGAKVQVADVSTSSGVIHVIDTLLFPPKVGFGKGDTTVIG